MFFKLLGSNELSSFLRMWPYISTCFPKSISKEVQTWFGAVHVISWKNDSREIDKCRIPKALSVNLKYFDFQSQNSIQSMLPWYKPLLLILKYNLCLPFEIIYCMIIVEGGNSILFYSSNIQYVQIDCWCSLFLVFWSFHTMCNYNWTSTSWI